MDYAGWKDRKPLATGLKAVYRAVDAEAAALALSEFEDDPWAGNTRHHRGLAAPGLQLREVTKNGKKRPAQEWHAPRAQFALLSHARFEMHQ